MKKPSNGLGKVFLKRFRKVAVYRSRVGARVGGRESERNTCSQRKHRFHLSSILLEKKKSKKERVPQPAPAEIPPQSTAVAVLKSQVPVSLPELQSGGNLTPSGVCSLSTQDLVRPNDLLKKSIEGFLLDQRSPHTRAAYGKDLKRFVQFLLVRNYQQGLTQINRTVLIAYKDSLLAEGLEHTTVDRHLATMRSFFKWLVDDGIIDKSPAEGVRFLNPKRISRTIGFSDEEVRNILAIPDLHTRTGALHYAILMVLFYCGLRRSELCELRTVNVGVERKQRVVRLRGKGNAERVIVMIPPVWNAIEYYFYIVNRNISHDTYLFLPVKNNRTKVINKSLDPSMIFYIVTKYARKAGISNRVSPHSCRATAISNARDHQVPDRAIQEFAGWASTDMITRYDKRKTAVEDSAAHSIVYGADHRPLPNSPELKDQDLPQSD